MTLPASLIISGKDLRQQLRSGTLLLFALVLPLGLALLFSSIMPSGENGFHATYAAADHDGGPAAGVFVDQVLGTVAADGTFDIRPADSAAHARQLVEQGDVDAAFVVPAGFSDDIDAGRTAELHVIGGADSATASHIARQVAESYATEIRGTQLAVAVTMAEAPDGDPAQVAQRAATVTSPLALRTDATATARELDLRTYYAAGMAVFFLFFVAMLSVTTILEERHNQTMSRLLAAPTSRVSILLGKLAGGVGVGLVAMVVLVAASTLLFGAAWGPTVGVAALVVAVVLAANGLMAMIATVARTSEQATNWMSVLAVLMGMFGGSFIPLAQLGDLAVIGYATPHRWFLQGLSDLAAGDLSVVVGPVAVLLGIAVASFALTTLRIGKVITP